MYVLEICDLHIGLAEVVEPAVGEGDCYFLIDLKRL